MDVHGHEDGVFGLRFIVHFDTHTALDRYFGTHNATARREPRCTHTQRSKAVPDSPTWGTHIYRGGDRGRGPPPFP
eukprot:2499509-Prymnesium_polylepis.2